MYDTKNFSIPTDSCFKERHDWGVERPTVLVLVKEGNSFLYLDKERQAEFPQTELALGETLSEATARVLLAFECAHEAEHENLVGYFSVGKKRIPHYLVIHFAEKTGRNKQGAMWIDPVTAVVNHRLFRVMSQPLLSLVAKMKPDDCLGWGERGLIIWPHEEQIVALQSTAAERLAA